MIVKRVCAMALCFWLMASGGVAAALEEGQRFTDWTVGCETLANNKERCFIYQTVKDKEDKPMLLAAVGYLPENSRPAAVFTVPLGVVLPPGLGLKVDADKPIRIPYERCLPQGCIAAVPLEQALLDKFKRGAKLEVIVFDNKGAVAIPKPLSLSGFTKGFNALLK